METTELLKSLEIFKRLTRTELEKIASICLERNFKQGDLIIEEGFLVPGIFIITYGDVQVVKGKTEIVSLGKGNLVGELSFIDDDDASASVIVKSKEVDTLMIDHEELRDLLEDNEKMAVKVYKKFLTIMSERLRMANKKQSELRAVS
ncbi:Crp/Fnr family transcriptional regulator [Patescibacteria group bacterium]